MKPATGIWSGNGFEDRVEEFLVEADGSVDQVAEGCGKEFQRIGRRGSGSGGQEGQSTGLFEPVFFQFVEGGLWCAPAQDGNDIAVSMVVVD